MSCVFRGAGTRQERDVTHACKGPLPSLLAVSPGGNTAVTRHQAQRQRQRQRGTKHSKAEWPQQHTLAMLAGRAIGPPRRRRPSNRRASRDQRQAVSRGGQRQADSRGGQRQADSRDERQAPPTAPLAQRASAQRRPSHGRVLSGDARGARSLENAPRRPRRRSSGHTDESLAATHARRERAQAAVRRSQRRGERARAGGSPVTV